MTTTTPTRPNPESGFMLMAVVVMVALILVALAAAAPVMARDLRRDKEVESIHRAQQYDRAIRLYYRKFKSYPPSMEALEKSNNIRFLRQQYVDPLTGKADWRIIHVGQNQTTVKGFFGEPLGGLETSGAGGGGLGTASTLGTGSSAGAPCTPTNALAGGFAGNSSSCAPGATGGSTTPGGTSTPGAGATTGTTGTTPSAFGAGSGGAGPIMGVGTSRTGESLANPNDQTTYETWEFLYDPRIEAMYAKGALGGGVGSQNASSFGKDAASGQPNSGSNTPTPGGPGGATPVP